MDDIFDVKKLFIWIICVLLVVGGVTWFFTRTDQVVTNGITDYEYFQSMYNSANEANTKLCALRALPDSDPSFEQFSKGQQVLSLQGKLTHIVEEYNAKSRVWTRSMWKSKTLPYELTVNDYSCYNEKK